MSQARKSVQWATMKAFLDARDVSPQYLEDNNFYYIVAADGFFEIETAIAKDGSEAADQADFENNYKSGANQTPVTYTETTITETPPFATPSYRTKHDATPSITSVTANDHVHIDFQLTAERYVSGGCLVVKNAQFGDYVTAEVYDKDSVIPEAYRAALCESWPVVALYTIKEWVRYQGDYTVHEIDTTPLNAKITAGLYLRVTYYAVDAGSTREILINYNLTKKL